MAEERDKGIVTEPLESEPGLLWKNKWMPKEFATEFFIPVPEQGIDGEIFEVRIHKPNEKGNCIVQVGFMRKH
jgi:hypothetical protein